MKFLPCERDMTSHCLDHWVLLISALLLTALGRPSDASGQIVLGTLVEQVTGVPIEGAAIVMLGPEDRRLDWTLTDAMGRFFFRMTGGGDFVLQAERIGHASTRSEDLQVGVGDTLVYRMEAVVEPIELAGLMVEGSGRDCEIRPEEGAATARVWEETRKALEAAAQTTKRGAYRFIIRRFDRQLDERGRKVVKETSQVDSRLQPRPFASLEAFLLIENGFVQPDGDGFIYYAPDADVLLSDEFLDSHCFRLSAGKDDKEGLLGLEFEPTKDRDVSEISGTFWIEPETAQLQHLEYSYENLGFSVGRAPIGGTLGFSSLPNGTWFVRTWSIRMPNLGLPRQRPMAALPFPQIRPATRVVGIHEEGALVLQVYDERGDLVVESGTGTIAGMVMWKDSNRPVTGAVVTVSSNDSDAITGDDGLFRLGSLGDGTYDLLVTHPSLTSLGHGGELTPVRAVSGEVTSVRLILPSEKRILDEVCVGPGPDKGGIIAGWVRHAETDEPIGDASVLLTTTRYQVVFETQIWTRRSGVEALTRDDGFFIYCGLGTARVIDIEVNAEGMEPWIGFVEVSGQEPIAHVSVRLTPMGREQ